MKEDKQDLDKTETDKQEVPISLKKGRKENNPGRKKKVKNILKGNVIDPSEVGKSLGRDDSDSKTLNVTTNDTVNQFASDKSKDDAILGDQNSPSVSNSTALNTNIANILMNSTTSNINIIKTDSNISNIQTIAFSNVELSVSVPDLIFKKLTDIPIWLKYDLYENRRYKLKYSRPYKLSENDISSIENMISALFNIWLKMTHDYSGIYVDQKDDVTNNYAINTGKRLVRNLLLPISVNTNPVSLFDGLHIEEGQLLADPDLINNHYFTETVTRKNEIDNLRYGVPYMLDRLSLEMFNRFTYDVNDLTALPAGFDYGMYDLTAEFNAIRPFMSYNVHLTTRDPGDTRPSLANRSYIRRFNIDLNFILFLPRYRLTLNKLQDKFSKAFLKPLVKAIKIEYRINNIVKDYFASTKFGTSKLRVNLDVQIQNGYVPSLAPDFVNSILLYLADPESYFILTDPSPGYDEPIWLLDKIFFLFFMKPQTMNKQYAGSLVRQVMYVIASKAGVTTGPSDPLFRVLGTIQPLISPELNLMFIEWIGYADGLFDPFNHILLYDNLGLRCGVNDTSGFNFWRAGALWPFRVNFTAEGDHFPIIRLVDCFTFTNINTVLYDWGLGLRGAVSIAGSRGDSSISRSMFLFQHAIAKITCSPTYINRFPMTKFRPVNISSKCFYSFMVGAILLDKYTIEFNATDMIRYIMTEQHWFSKGFMYYEALLGLDANVTQFSGLQGQNGFYLKPHIQKYKVAEFLPLCLFKELLSETEGLPSSISDLDVLSVGNNQVGDLFQDLRAMFGADFMPFGRWRVESKTYEFVNDFANLRHFGLRNSFIYGKPIIRVGDDKFRRKIVNRPIMAHVPYRTSILRFGSSDFTRMFNRIESDNGGVRVIMPTILKEKIVKEFSDDDSNFNDNTDKIKNWVKKRKPLISINDGTMVYASITNELNDSFDIKYNEELEFWESNTVYCESDEFYTRGVDDLNLILYGEVFRHDLLLEPLVDNTGEIYEGFPGTYRIAVMSSFV